MNEILVKNYSCDAAIEAYLIVKHVAGRKVAVAAASTAPLAGVTNISGDAGGQIDVVHIGFQAVRLGGTVTAGQALMADSQGRAIAATDGKYCIGYAVDDGSVDEIADVRITAFKN